MLSARERKLSEYDKRAEEERQRPKRREEQRSSGEPGGSTSKTGERTEPREKKRRGVTPKEQEAPADTVAGAVGSGPAASGVPGGGGLRPSSGVSGVRAFLGRWSPFWFPFFMGSAQGLERSGWDCPTCVC